MAIGFTLSDGQQELQKNAQTFAEAVLHCFEQPVRELSGEELDEPATTQPLPPDDAAEQ